MRCFRCKAAGHDSDGCTTNLNEKRGGIEHESRKFASPAGMDNRSPAEAVLGMVGPGDDAPETVILGLTMFHKRLLFRVALAPDKLYDQDMRKRTYPISLYRYDLRIYGESRWQKENLSVNEVPRNL